MASTAKPAPSWRDILPVHPAAELFPLMGEDEVAALGADIRKNGLREPVTVVRQYRRGGDGKFDVREYDLALLDGRNRLDAMEGAGFKLVCDGKLDKTLGHKALGLEPFNGTYAILNDDVDPYDFVISANIHRRHLTIEDRDRLIVDVLKADPSKSNRQVAKMVGASHPHVAKVRGQAEKAGDVETVTTSVDTKGRQQPAKRKRGSRGNPATFRAMKLGEYTKSGAAFRREDIGPDSGDELARLRALVEELQAENRRLENKITGLGSEVAELHRPETEAANGEAVDADASMLGILLKIWDRASEPVRQRFMTRVGLVRDGAFPPFLDRRTREARS
jgi:DNA-binding Lrp family transcriptional regulator